MTIRLPRLLVIDDLFGRGVVDGRNEDRTNLCGRFLLRDVTGDDASSQRVREPIAEAVFIRGQRPVAASIGDKVENDLEGSLELVRQGWEVAALRPRWALVLLDLCFYTGKVTATSGKESPGMPKGRPGDDDPSEYFGLALLRELHRRWPELPVVILSSKERDEVSRRLAMAGALGFVQRVGSDGPRLLAEHIWRHGLIPDDAGEILGGSVPLLLALRDARRAAGSSRHVLIRGERGSGKELLARYLHRQSRPAAGRPFVVVNAATLNPNLFASELFGHVRGAFTDASVDRSGCLVDADGGDLFLDEIGSLPPDVQPALLRVLDRGEVTPVGGKAGRTVTVRVLAATNEDIEQGDEGAGFRADLLDRLREGGTIVLPPLRDRPDDIPLLAERFVREAERSCSGLEREITPEVEERLRSHSWAGNVRELRSSLFEAVRNHSDIEHLTVGHLPRSLDTLDDPGSASTPVGSESGRLDSLIHALESFEFEGIEARELLGKLPALQDSCGDLLARYLGATLRTQVRPTPDAPDGKLLIHPALILAMGAPDLAATKAYDLIIKLRHMSTGDSWDHDELLRVAYERAMRARRPASRHTRSAQTGSGSHREPSEHNEES